MLKQRFPKYMPRCVLKSIHRRLIKFGHRYANTFVLLLVFLFFSYKTDDELQITGEEQLDSMKSHKQEAHHTEVVTFIDGNVEFDSSVPPTGGISGKIKINITKPLPVIAPKENTNKELSSELEKTAESIDPSQPLPPGEEPIQLNLKPALQGVKLKKIPPVKKGTELTGLCSIM